MPRQEFLILKALYPDFASHRCMMHNEETGETDPIGQILLQMGHNPDRLRIPSELKIAIPPFTTKIRSRIVDTPYTLELLQAFNTSIIHRHKTIEDLLHRNFKVQIE